MARVVALWGLASWGEHLWGNAGHGLTPAKRQLHWRARGGAFGVPRRWVTLRGRASKNGAAGPFRLRQPKGRPRALCKGGIAGPASVWVVVVKSMNAMGERG